MSDFVILTDSSADLGPALIEQYGIQVYPIVTVRQIIDMLHNKEIDMVVNVPKNLSTGELTNGYKIRRAAIDLNVPLITNARLASAFIYAFCTVKMDELEIKSWQEY